MKVLLLTMLTLLTIQTNANPLQSFVIGNSSPTAKYSIEQLKAILASNKVACFTYKRKVYPSKGYIAKFKTVKQQKAFCTKKRAESAGVTRLNKDNLTNNALMALLNS